MNKTNSISEQPVNDRLDITLMDGRTLSCVLKSEQPKEIKADAFQLDTTGQYLTMGEKRKPVEESEEKKEARRYNYRLFTENAWFLFNNAERIFNNSRMFFAPVNIENHLAYIGTNGFKDPTLGVYLEWWLNCGDASIDANGNLVWYISGSPLSGCNACSSVTLEGKQVPIEQHTRFSDIWRSFRDVNNRYNEAKQRCEAYTLEEVLRKLQEEAYN